MRRRRFLLGLAAGVLAAGAGTAAYAHWFEPTWWQVTRPRPRFPRDPAQPPLRIVQLTDLHVSNVFPLASLARALDEVIALRPDAVLMTGDYVTGPFADLPGYTQVLRKLTAVAPVCASPGNHDGGRWAVEARRGYNDVRVLARAFEEAGVTFLVNRRHRLTLRGRGIDVVGLGDVWTGQFRPLEAFGDGQTAAGVPVIALSHNPDTVAELEPYSWDLVLCGHTHGGQVRVPWVGPLAVNIRDRRFAAGLAHLGERPVYTSRGVGNLLGVRFNCRPELTLLDL